MAGKEKTLVNQIEKLIVDGNKEVIKEVDQKIENIKNELKQELGGKIDRIEVKVDRIDRTLNATAHASHGLLTDVRNEVGEVKTKVDEVEKILNEHVRLPAHA